MLIQQSSLLNNENGRMNSSSGNRTQSITKLHTSQEATAFSQICSDSCNVKRLYRLANSFFTNKGSQS